MLETWARTFMTATRTEPRFRAVEKPRLRIPGDEDPFLRRMPFADRVRR